jgi:tRNA threonylcarbamoyladenosine biosynthesis protein TsaE
VKVEIADETAMQDFGALLAKGLPDRCICYLQGDLGAGKTTLVRAVVREFGYPGLVKSPTYTLVEPYEIGTRTVLHMDLYRLADAEELEFLGVRDYLTGNSIWFVEWPDKGAGFLPQADVVITIDYADSGRVVEIVSKSPNGDQLMQGIQA